MDGICHDILTMPEDELFGSAKALREQYFGNDAGLCAIINIRNGRCGMNCKFCAQSAHYESNVKAHALLPPGELRQRIFELASLPVKNIGLVSSGACLEGRDFDILCDCVASIPQEIRDRLCASLGRLSPEHLRQLYSAGIRHYHHNLETCRAFYPRICNTQLWDERKKTVLAALDTGFEVCSGGLFGLGESWTDRVEFARELDEIGTGNIPINFLIPQPGTPLASSELLTPEEGLRIIALFRHMLPRATLRICGGRDQILGTRQAMIFAAGANAMMTGNYLTTRGPGFLFDQEILAEAGMKIMFPRSMQSGKGAAF